MASEKMRSESRHRGRCVLLTIFDLRWATEVFRTQFRDPDSAVRSACVEAVSAMSTHITAPPFSALSKPLIEVLTVEQDFNSQIGAAMCLAAAIEATPEPDVEQLRKVLPRLGKLAKSEGFKAKAAVFGGARGKEIMDWLVTCLLEFLSSEDWATRKSATEAMGKVAVAEKELCKEHKASCLTSLETRRFDKVKLVREAKKFMWKDPSRVLLIFKVGL